MDHLILRQTPANIGADFKTRRITIRKDNNSPGLRQSANQRHLFFIFKNTEPIGLNNHCVEQGGQLDLIILPLHDHSLFDTDHDCRTILFL